MAKYELLSEVVERLEKEGGGHRSLCLGHLSRALSRGNLEIQGEKKGTLSNFALKSGIGGDQGCYWSSSSSSIVQSTSWCVFELSKIRVQRVRSGKNQW